MLGPNFHGSRVDLSYPPPPHAARYQEVLGAPVRFGCTCGPEKVVLTLAAYPAEDIAAMTTADGKVTADCQFCGAHYEFDPKERGTDGQPG